MCLSIRKRINRIIWKKRNKHNFTWTESVFPMDKVQVGNYSYGPIDVISYTFGDCRLKIGHYCSIAREVQFILGGEHEQTKISTYPFDTFFDNEKPNTKNKGDIVVEDDVWFGFGATVLSGVTIGQGAIVGARSLVCNDVPPYSVVGGVPARVIKYRFDESIIPLLQKIDYSKISHENYPKFREILIASEVSDEKIRSLLRMQENMAI